MYIDSGEEYTSEQSETGDTGRDDGWSDEEDECEFLRSLLFIKLNIVESI